MHKDEPPGIFDFPHRTVRHSIGLGLATGVVLGCAVHLGLLIKRADSGGSEKPLAGADAAEREMAKHRKQPTNPPPAAPPAVNY